jgi:pyruvate ferredoxin oxidoreductase gamma subunit
VDVFAGLADAGRVLINTSRSFEQLGLKELAAKYRFCAVPATELALKHVGRPVPNAALLGGFAAIAGMISIGAVAAAIREKFSGAVAEGNAAAAAAAHEFVRREIAQAAHA